MSSKTFITTLHGIGITGIIVASATHAAWLVPYCALYMLGSIYVHISS